ncbi:hypothetical protein PGB90_005824 [Kerria lacca]
MFLHLYEKQHEENKCLHLGITWSLLRQRMRQYSVPFCFCSVAVCTFGFFIFRLENFSKY